MLINLSNHQYAKWSEEQAKMSKELFGEVIDLNFPNINPEMSETEVLNTAYEYTKKCLNLISTQRNQENAVHVMGEFTLTYSIVNGLLKNGVKCITSTTERHVEENGDMKITVFKFVKFREYRNL